MKGLQIFDNPEFGKIRMVEINGKPFAVGNDVAKALEYARPYEAISAHCKGAVSYRVTDALGREQETKVIPQGDILRLIVKAADQSKNPIIKEKAEKFERWIFDEVLPAVIEHGAHSNVDFMIPKTFAQALQLAANLQLQIEEQAPKVLFADSVAGSKGSCLVGELAKIIKQNGIDIGQNRLFGWMRENGYLGKRGDNYNLPTQKSMELGLFEIIKTTITHANGATETKRTCKVTGKGCIYFVDKFKRQISA